MRRATIRTWHVESAVVLVVLSLVAALSGNRPAEWIGTVAVWLSFGHASIADRMAERQAQRARPDVECYRKAALYFVGKEALWVAYFVAHHSYAALVGCGVFLVYPAWRRLWRRLHPLARD